MNAEEKSPEFRHIENTVNNNDVPLTEVAELFTREDWDDKHLAFGKECLSKRLQQFQWAPPGRANTRWYEDANAQAQLAHNIEAILQMRLKHKGKLIDATIMRQLLQTPEFRPVINRVMILLLYSFLEEDEIAERARKEEALASAALGNLIPDFDLMHEDDDMDWGNVPGNVRRNERVLRNAVANWITRMSSPGDNELQRIPFRVSFSGFLKWWDECLARLQSERLMEATNKKTVVWILQSHIFSICGQIHYQDTLEYVPIIARDVGRHNELLLDAIGLVLRTGNCEVRIKFEKLFPERDFLQYEQYKKTSSWHSSLIRDLASSGMEELLAHLTRGKGDLTMDVLLSLDSALATCRFFFWASQFSKPYNKSPVWKTVFQMRDTIREVLQRGIEDILSATCTVGFIRKCKDIPVEELRPVFDVLGLPEMMKAIFDLHDEINTFRNLLGKVKQVTQTFIPNTTVYKNILDMESFWFRQSILQLRAFLSPSEELRKVKLRKGVKPLPQELFDCLRWYLILVDSALFMRIWNEVDPSIPNDMQKLGPASQDWVSLLTSLNDKSITFQRLIELAHFLDSAQERTKLLQTASGYSQKNGVNSWIVKEDPNSSMVDALGTTIRDWQHLYAIYLQLPNIARTLSFLGTYIRPEGMETLYEVQQSVTNLTNAFRADPFETRKLSDFHLYAQDAKNIHPCLPLLNPEVFKAAKESQELLDWIRRMPSDAEEFGGGLQIAMGKSEMECPVDLWKEEPGKPGRVDEEKLSMLKTVHSYLHNLIYRPEEKFERFDGLVQTVLRNIGSSDENTVTCILTSQKFLIPLQELLGSSNDSAAPDKLMQLQHPSKEAKWILTTSTSQYSRRNEKGSSAHEGSSNSNRLIGQLFLVWNVKRHGKQSTQIQNLQELMDFQSNLVLSKTDNRGEEVNTAIESFIAQFGRMQQLHGILSQLHESGHFEYHNFEISFSMQDDAQKMLALVHDKQKVLSSWESEVSQKRELYYFLNFFSMKQLWYIVEMIDRMVKLDKAPTSAELEQLASHFRVIHSEIGRPGASSAEMNISTIFTTISSMWKKLITSTGTSSVSDLIASDILDICGKTINAALEKVPIRYRKVDIAHIQEYAIGGADFSSGVHVVCSDPLKVYDSALTIYANLGYLPEWQEVLVCSESTTWEELSNLLNRWKSSHLYGREGRMYSLVAVHELSFELQRKTVMGIRDSMRLAVNPLLIVSGSDNQHIVAQLAHCRVSITEVPSDVLSGMGAALSKQYSKTVTVYSSNHAGAGKTFQIQTAALERDTKCVHVVVTSSDGFFSKIYNVISNTDSDMPLTIHLDLMDTVREDFNKIIFELVFLGGIVNNIGMGEQYFWDPQETAFAIELSSGPLISRLRICRNIPISVCHVNGDTFCADSIGLQIGMGEDFDTTRTDGTIADKSGKTSALRKSKSTTSTAFDRLQYVCVALDIMDVNAGQFPYIFEGTSTPTQDSLQCLRNSSQLSSSGNEPTSGLTGSRCFELLLKNSLLDPASPSLWCIWNFVNVLYWQFKGMHQDDSPINCAVMPDPNSQRKDEKMVKEKYKGEVIKFLIRTAREFATRQVKSEYNPDEVVELETQGFSKWEWRGKWQKQGFTCDDQPVFRRNNYYLYFRSITSCWVIDDGVVPTGAVFSKSVSADIHGQWSTNAQWEPNADMKIREISNKNGYEGKALQISGCVKKGAGCSISENENGIYLRMPPEMDIDGHPHYFMEKSIPGTQEPLRRHIFFSNSERTWVLCPLCTMEAGAYAICVNPQRIEGQWKSIPPNLLSQPTITFITAKDKPTPGRPAPVSTSTPAPVQEMSPDHEVAKAMEELSDKTLAWNDSNHECLMFSNISNVVSFLSLNPQKMREMMHPGLRAYLEKNKVNVGEDLDKLNHRHHEVLSSLTEVSRTREEALALLDGKYCLTGDALLKMLAIFVRIRCGVPVVLMGECGCGKTMLIQYLCAWLGVKLIVEDIHGGTTEGDIMAAFDRAEDAIQQGHDQVYVFLDEVNTCPHMGLISEVIVHRSLYGRRISDGIQVLSALNPYRFRAQKEHTPGLVFQLHSKSKNATPDPMAHLVYRVHPIPLNLRDFIFDFGSLSRATERLYIHSMTSGKLSSLGIDSEVVDFIGDLIVEAQFYIRQVEQDNSSTSLRDVNRCLNLIMWFYKNTESKKKSKKSTSSKKEEAGETKEPRSTSRKSKSKSKSKTASTASSPAAVADPNAKPKIGLIETATILGLAFVYYFRLAKSVDRLGLWSTLQRSREVRWNVKGVRSTGFERLRAEGEFDKNLNKIKSTFCRNVEIKEEGIAMNDALMENLFVLIICILNKIPCFLVGKPGSSKTLAMQVIASNLQGRQSSNSFWRKYPAVYMFQYQCSPMSDSYSIQHQFDMAVRYQKHAQETITILLLDEVGLAEHSPDMPLKVLHGMLVNPPIAIVGLSNWVLDPAKMNRAILLQRTEPTELDIEFTGKCIMTLPTAEVEQSEESKSSTRGKRRHTPKSKGRSQDQDLSQWLGPLAKAYHEIYVGQKGRDFVGMRDYYNLVKLLRSEMKSSNRSFDEELLKFALCRNFGGKPELMSKILTAFYRHCFGKHDISSGITLPSVNELVLANLRDKSARHLMVLTRNSAALQLLIGCDVLDPKTEVLVGSQFADDNTELHLITQINQVKNAMARGATIVLLNHDNIYEALYDVLNQRYVIKNDPKSGGYVRMLRLAIGSRSQLCQVGDDFKIVVIVEQDHAYRSLDLPLLNRFEKQVLCPTDVLSPQHWEAVNELKEWTTRILDESNAGSYQHVFCGYHEGTLASAVLSTTNYRDDGIQDKNSRHAVLENVKRWMLLIAMPITVMHSPSLQALKDVDYFNDLENLQKLTNKIVQKTDEVGSISIIFTHSPASHLVDASLSANDPLRDGTPVQFQLLPLAELTSEKDFSAYIHNFFHQDTSSSTLLLVQCDPIVCQQSLIDHARQVVVRVRADYQGELRSFGVSRGRRHVMFLVHLPLGVLERERHYSVDFHLPWSYYFVDDIRNANVNADLDTKSMLTTSAFELAKQSRLPIRAIMLSRFQSALASCTVPYTDSQVSAYTYRIGSLQKLLQIEQFQELFYNLVLDVLEHDTTIRLKENKQRQVLLVTEDCLGGSLRESLQIALEKIIVRSMAYVLRALDRNFNLSLLVSDSSSSYAQSLWFSLASNESILDLEDLKTTSNLGSRTFDQVENNGKDGAVVAQFPFSYRVVNILNADTQKAHIESSTGDKYQQLHQISDQLFGKELQALWNQFAENDHTAYLHDYVAYVIPPYPGLDFVTKLSLYELIIRATRLDAMQNVSSIHVAAWENENRLFHYCSMLSNLPSNYRSSVVSRIKSVVKDLISSVTENTAEASMYRLACIDICLLEYLLGELLQQFSDVCTELEKGAVKTFCSRSVATWEAWLLNILKVNTDVGDLVLNLSKLEGLNPLWNGNSISLKNIWQQWVALGIICNYLQEVVLPTGGNISTEHLLKMRDVALQADSTSVAYCKSLVDTATESIARPEDYQAVSGFLRRFIEEVLYAQDYGRYGLVCTQSPSIIEFLIELLNAKSMKQAGFTSEVCQSLKQGVILDLPLRRAILQALITTEKSQNLHLDLVRTSEVAQLYLNNHMDRNLDDPFTEEDVDELTKKDMTSLLAQDGSCNSAKELRKHMDSIGRAVIALKAHTADLAAYARAVERSPEGAGKAPSASRSLSKLLNDKSAHLARLMGLKMLKNVYGVDSIAVLMQRDIPWFPLNAEKARQLVNATETVPDPFVWLENKEVYNNICSAVRTVVSKQGTDTSSVDAIVPTLSGDRVASLLIASCYTQTITCKSDLPKGGPEKMWAWLKSWASHFHSPAENKYYSWICSGCPGTWADGIREQFHKQLGLNLLIVAMTVQRSWIHHFFCEFSNLGTVFLPSIPDDPFAVAEKALHGVGWYRCPNGHKYSVGECTMPMQKSRCPECGATIGGENHVSVRGVERIQAGAAKSEQKGYYLESSNETTGRLSGVCERILRYFVHCALYIYSNVIRQESSDHKEARQAFALHILGQNVQKRTFEAAVEKVHKRLNEDWEALLKISKLKSERDLAIGLHLCLKQWLDDSRLGIKTAPVLDTASKRNDFERHFNKVCVEPVFSEEEIRKYSGDLEESGKVSALRACLGDIWFELHEEVSNDMKKAAWTPTYDTLMWRYRESVTFDHFVHTFHMKQSNSTKYPVLGAFLEQESELSTIKFLADMLEWHHFLFTAFKSNELSREQAQEVTNKTVLDKLPASKRQYAQSVFERFAEAFNRELPQIELFDCKQNPFITKFPGGEVDLTGAKRSLNPMEIGSSVIFSLPNRPSTVGDQDIYGRCTIDIINQLTQRHNRILDKLRNPQADEELKGQEDGAPEAAAQSTVHTQEIPPLSYLTPREFILRNVIDYNRSKHLLPFLRIFAVQSLEFSEGATLEFDFKFIEQALSNSLLAGKMPIHVNIHHYHYAGDVRSSGNLIAMSARVHQENLPTSVCEEIIKEVDNQMHMTNFMSIVEMCISFIATIGTHNVKTLDGSTKLHEFVLGSLMLSPVDWNAATTQTVNNNVRLCHLRHLFMLLEEHTQGNPLDNMFADYREPLTPENESSLRDAAKHLDVGVLVAGLREFMIGRLCGKSREDVVPYYIPQMILKETIEIMEMESLDTDWFYTYFPDNITTAQVYYTFQLLKDFEGR